MSTKIISGDNHQNRKGCNLLKVQQRYKGGERRCTPSAIGAHILFTRRGKIVFVVVDVAAGVSI